MSEQLTLSAEARDRAGKGASRALRREGRVPAVIYGNNEEPQSIHVEEKLLNKLLGTGNPTALRGTLASVRAMLDVLGLDPADPAWGPAASGDERLTAVVDVLDQRATARAEKDFATADAIRDRLKQAGVEITDTPDGQKWSLA